MNGNIEIKVNGIGDNAGQDQDLTAEIAIIHGVSRVDEAGSIGINTIIGGSFRGKIDLVNAYGKATAQAIHSLAEDDPRIIEEFESAYKAHSAKLADETVKRIREEILEKSPFSREATEAILNKIEEAADCAAAAAYAERKRECMETS